jgi:hypothetical protein
MKLDCPRLSEIDTQGIPVQRVNTTGLVLLGYMENNSENLDIGAHKALEFGFRR